MALIEGKEGQIFLLVALSGKWPYLDQQVFFSNLLAVSVSGQKFLSDKMTEGCH